MGWKARWSRCNGGQTVRNRQSHIEGGSVNSSTGKVIALGYSDGVTRICDVNNGKMVLTISPDSPEFGVVSCVGWVDNRMAPTPAPSHWRDPQLVPGEIIPRGVLDLEINQMLPRLSVLPAGAGPYVYAQPPLYICLS